MSVLHLDLRENATRHYLFETVLAHLVAAKQDAVRTSLAAAGVPDKHHHGLPEVVRTIDALQVSSQVKADMRAVYNILAAAEAQVHGCRVEETHFHEVGNAEAIRNVVGICLGLEALAPARITATAVQTGSGTVTCAHGVLNIPAPATAAILATGIPTCKNTLEGELCTPTSAALIKHFVSEFVEAAGA
ncbi:MAG: nickel insertion protein [Raoultibacter sp.]